MGGSDFRDLGGCPSVPQPLPQMQKEKRKAREQEKLNQSQSQRTPLFGVMGKKKNGTVKSREGRGKNVHGKPFLEARANRQLSLRAGAEKYPFTLHTLIKTERRGRNRGRSRVETAH